MDTFIYIIFSSAVSAILDSTMDVNSISKDLNSNDLKAENQTGITGIEGLGLLLNFGNPDSSSDLFNETTQPVFSEQVPSLVYLNHS